MNPPLVNPNNGGRIEGQTCEKIFRNENMDEMPISENLYMLWSMDQKCLGMG